LVGEVLIDCSVVEFEEEGGRSSGGFGGQGSGGRSAEWPRWLFLLCPELLGLSRALAAAAGRNRMVD